MTGTAIHSPIALPTLAVHKKKTFIPLITRRPTLDHISCSPSVIEHIQDA
jgi:hypothetical protein